MNNIDSLGIDYTQLQEIGIIFGMCLALITAIVTGVKRIYCKGKDDSKLHDRITLLEAWKEQHIKEYQKLQEVNEEVKQGLADVGKKLAYLTGLLEGNGNGHKE